MVSRCKMFAQTSHKGFLINGNYWNDNYVCRVWVCALSHSIFHSSLSNADKFAFHSMEAADTTSVWYASICDPARLEQFGRECGDDTLDDAKEMERSDQVSEKAATRKTPDSGRHCRDGCGCFYCYCLLSIWLMNERVSIFRHFTLSSLRLIRCRRKTKISN